jgi:hypothetical protein
LVSEIFSRSVLRKLGGGLVTRATRVEIVSGSVVGKFFEREFEFVTPTADRATDRPQKHWLPKKKHISLSGVWCRGKKNWSLSKVGRDGAPGK